MTASSRSKGRFVAARTITRSVSLVSRPSQFIMNSFLILRVASCSPGLPLWPSMLSAYKTVKYSTSVSALFTSNIHSRVDHAKITSSTKIMLGDFLLANEKTALTFFTVPP